MSHNLYSACHKCKVRIFHYRGEENNTILPFYKKHRLCAKEDIDNVQTIMDNNGVEPDWVYSEDYKDDVLQVLADGKFYAGIKGLKDGMQEYFKKES